MRCSSYVLVAVLLAVPAARAAEDSRYLIADPSAAQRLDYLIVAGDKFANDLDPLAAHREKGGRAVGVVRMSALKKQFESVRGFLAHAVTKWKKPAPSYLLLVGDVDAVPTAVKKSAYHGFMSEKDLATDFDYARPLGDKTLLHVGRFPCDTREELAAMIRKTIAYETKLPGGRWQRTLHFIASVGGFGKEIDSLLEGIGMFVASNSVPAAFDIQAAYGNPGSPYCPYPPKFNAHVINMFNEGSLLTVFVGHGSHRGVASIEWRGRNYPIFNAGDAKSLAVRNGLPILVLVACHTGRLDIDDCLGETFFKAEKGPVAFVGGSRVTQPYANGVFAKAFVDAFFGKARTLGEVITQAKQTIIANRPSMFRLQVDAVGAIMQGRKALELMRKDVVQHYNLLGDPALVIRRPKADITLTVRASEVHIDAPGRTKIELTLECDRLMFLHKLPRIDPDDPEPEAKMADRYKKALDKMIQRWSVELKDGKGKVDVKLPKRPGRYFLKASSGSGVGSATIVIQPPKAKTP